MPALRAEVTLSSEATTAVVAARVTAVLPVETSGEEAAVTRHSTMAWVIDAN
jgi:hypothetical protein